MRLFLAIDLPVALKAALRARLAEVRGQDEGVRWIREDALHVTLRFLGAVPDAQVPELSIAVARGVRGTGPLALHLSGGGRFPRRGRPRVLWVGVTGEVEALAALQARVEAAVVASGFEPEARPFHPHVTVARVKRGRAAHAARALEALGDVGPLPVGEIVLYRSELSPEGARYHPVQRFPT